MSFLYARPGSAASTAWFWPIMPMSRWNFFSCVFCAARVAKDWRNWVGLNPKHKDAAPVGFDASAISPGTAAKDGEVDGHRRMLDVAEGGGQLFFDEVNLTLGVIRA